MVGEIKFIYHLSPVETETGTELGEKDRAVLPKQKLIGSKNVSEPNLNPKIVPKGKKK